ncbi:extracellular solute-binding protein [Paenibacillus sp. HJGM_3]|uniref:extracellular solute-binding protein n=1 Tax=Paenibacillus sp. HJGM_3 TaxID=3379816 RepID=UPI00385C9A90
MKKTLALALLTTVVGSTTLLSACSSDDTTKPAQSAQPTQPAASSSGSASAKPDAKADPLGKYENPVTVSMVLGARPPEDKNTPQGLTPDQNGYLKKLKEMLNIEVKYNWVVPYDQFTQKFSLTVASGDLPDVMWIDAADYEKFKEQGVLADLSEAYAKYASPTIKSYVESDGGETLKLFKDGNKLFGIPSFNDPNLSLQTLWIRSDWLKKLNLQPPKTFEELEKIAEAFVKNDPDGNGKADTYGLAINKKLNFWGLDARGFFYTMGAYPYNFIKGADGKLVAGETTPETRKSLEKLADWYKRGLLDKEWAFKDENKVMEDIVADKVGISFGEWWYPNWPLNIHRDKNKEADWINLPLPSYEGKPGKSLVPRYRMGKILVVNKKAKNPEAAIKMANFYYEMAKEEYAAINTPANGWVYLWYEPRISNSLEMEQIYTEVNAALKEKKDTVKGSNPSVLPNFKAAKQFLSGDMAGWGLYFSRVAEDGGWGVTRKVKEQKLTVRGENPPVATPTQVEKGASLTKLTDETFTKIIMGSSPISEFDKYVESWKKLGGDDLTKEVGDWLTKHP